MKKLTEVKYEVIYEPIILRKVGDLMSKLDLGIDGLSSRQCIHVIWVTTSRVNSIYLKKMEEILKIALETSGLYVIKLRKL